MRLRRKIQKPRRNRMTEAQRTLKRIRDAHRLRSMAVTGPEHDDRLRRLDRLARSLPADGSRRRLAEEIGCKRAPSHNSPVIALQSIRKGCQKLYVSQVRRVDAVLDRYRALGYDC